MTPATAYFLGLATLPMLLLLAIWATEASPRRALRRWWSWSDYQGHRYRPWDRVWMRSARIVGYLLANEAHRKGFPAETAHKIESNRRRARFMARRFPWLPVLLYPPHMGDCLLLGLFGPKVSFRSFRIKTP